MEHIFPRRDLNVLCVCIRILSRGDHPTNRTQQLLCINGQRIIAFHNATNLTRFIPSICDGMEYTRVHCLPWCTLFHSLGHTRIEVNIRSIHRAFDTPQNWATSIIFRPQCARSTFVVPEHTNARTHLAHAKTIQNCFDICTCAQFLSLSYMFNGCSLNDVEDERTASTSTNSIKTTTTPSHHDMVTDLQFIRPHTPHTMMMPGVQVLPSSPHHAKRILCFNCVATATTHAPQTVTYERATFTYLCARCMFAGCV